MKTNGNKIGSFGSDRNEKTPANGTVKGDKIYDRISVIEGKILT